MKFTLEPLDDKVAILPDAPLEKHGNLIVPDVAREAGRLRTGRVLAVGPGRWATGYSPDELRPKIEAILANAHCHGCDEYACDHDEGDTTIFDGTTLEAIIDLLSKSQLQRVPMTVKAGDYVQFSQYGTDGFQTLDDVEVLVITEQRILGVFKE